MWLWFSINVLTLLAIVLATGLVVDDGGHREYFSKVEEGMTLLRAAIKDLMKYFLR
jgi:multidrug efflux pump subunit AcrB